MTHVQWSAKVFVLYIDQLVESLFVGNIPSFK